MASPAVFLAADRVWSFSPSVFPLVGLPFFLVMVGGWVWSYKEFERPTLRRTPAWVREEMERDSKLRAVGDCCRIW